MDIAPFPPGTIVVMKKPHPCGGVRWEIVRKGADVKIKCCTCGRFVMLLPDELARRVRRVEGVESEE